jgi:hypothetical protein
VNGLGGSYLTIHNWTDEFNAPKVAIGTQRENDSLSNIQFQDIETLLACLSSLSACVTNLFRISPPDSWPDSRMVSIWDGHPFKKKKKKLSEGKGGHSDRNNEL